MASAALDVLRRRGTSPAGGLIVGPSEAVTPDSALEYTAGDHPEPGQRSLAAAAALERTIRRVGRTDEVWLLLSGGTSSLIAAPEAGLTPAELTSIYSLLLSSGLDITAMNRIRKRFSRWGGGKLARALAPAKVRGYVISDVIGDDLASIGSGPCVPDPTTAREVREQLEQHGIWRRLPESGRSLVLSVESGNRPETPKPGEDVFTGVSLEVIASNWLALEAAATRARELGLAPVVSATPLSGEAATAGALLARHLLHRCAQSDIRPETRVCLIWGGETTVSLGEQTAGLGGRCQELALAAARELRGAPEGVVLLAAGTDGRDGPTDAAGAIVDGRTWQAIEGSGRNPAHDLAGHNAYPALAAAGALLRTGLTGTNVMDVVIGCCL
jgi:glycerate 2-kinase